MTNQYMIKASVTALTLTATLGLAGCGGNDAGSTSSAAPQTPSASSSTSTGSPTAAVFNSADVMFVQGMLPHHEQAVEMSDTLLMKSGVSPETRQLAEQIKAAQQPEIDTMTGWLETWGKSRDNGMGGMNHRGSGGMGGGMATDAEMRKFDQADGADAEKMYLEMMTKHHRGAITMAKTEIADGENPDALQLANTIATSQQAEIDTMQQLLAKL
jgi:uncharacterized protein (DUF305 family)